MAIVLNNNYMLRIVFGDKTEVVNSPDILHGCTITSDLDYIVPTFDLSLKSEHGLIHQLVTPDRRLNNIRIEIARDLSASEYNTYNFVLFRSYPQDTVYRVTGYLDVDNLFAPLKSRGFNDSVKTILENISKDEFNISNTDVSPTLEGIRKNLIQPAWPNIDLIRHLKRNLVGTSDYDFYYSCFIKMEAGHPVFVFKALNDFLLEETKYNFVYGDIPIPDVQPILDYKIFNNMQVLGAFGSQQENYGYFDYDNDEYVSDVSLSVDNYPSLSQYFLIDDKEVQGEVDNDSFFILGRNNSFTSDFKGHVGRKYYELTTNLAQLWITTKGLPDIQPGNIVSVFFPQGLDEKNITGLPYNGYWLVKRVIHAFGSDYLTRLLLIRSGVDTDVRNTLIPAINFVQRNAIMKGVDVLPSQYSGKEILSKVTDTDVIDIA